MRSPCILLIFFVSIFVVMDPVQARTVVTLPTADTVHEVLQLMDDFKGDAKDFRVAIAEQLFDPEGVNVAIIIIDRALGRGWKPDGFTRILSFRVYRFKNIHSDFESKGVVQQESAWCNHDYTQRESRSLICH